MKILLVGEYSGLHNNLREGLIELGEEVTLISDGDGFKKLYSDISLSDVSKNGFGKIRKRLENVFRLPRELQRCEIVQFIAALIPPFNSQLPLNKFFIKGLMHKSQMSFLVAAGDDSVVWDYWSTHPLNYSFIDASMRHYESEGMRPIWEKKRIRDWNLKLANQVDGIIPVMYEYDKPYKSLYGDQKTRTIPIPINTKKVQFRENEVKRKLVIFHGLNRYYAKGTDIVEKAFEILRKRYPNDLELIIKGKMSYQEYLHVFDRANIVIDQLYSYSLGISGLIALSKGKIVMGGNEAESNAVLGYKSCPAINVTPDVNSIVSCVENLLERRNEIPDLAIEGRSFIEEYHDYVKVANLYRSFWMSREYKKG